MDQGSKQWRSLTAHINSYIRMAINDQRHTCIYTPVYIYTYIHIYMYMYQCTYVYIYIYNIRRSLTALSYTSIS